MNTSKTCEKIVNRLIREGFRMQVAVKDIDRAIMEERDCIDPRTVENWRRALTTREYIIREAAEVFRLNPLKIPELMKLLHDKPQTKLQ
jgi:hypothetical protein